MKKSNFVALILGTIGGVFFALGMCMALLPEWGMFRQGIVCGVIGLVILFITLLAWRKMEHKAPIKLNAKTVGSVALGVVGALVLGVGMCLVMAFDKMVPGILVGVVVLLLMLIPVAKGIHDGGAAHESGDLSRKRKGDHNFIGAPFCFGKEREWRSLSATPLFGIRILPTSAAGPFCQGITPPRRSDRTAGE